ncbi:MAG: hypothetical protein Q8N53_11375 [Longimicrobiales bacterium]|nr:hypothetical protein [Longimicrobiales bacterium]
MRSWAKYVGLDVHQATTVLSVRDGSGRVLARSVVATEEGALTGFLGSLRGNVSVVLEEIADDIWAVSFGPVPLGWFHVRVGRILDHDGNSSRNPRR